MHSKMGSNVRLYLYLHSPEVMLKVSLPLCTKKKLFQQHSLDCKAACAHIHPDMVGPAAAEASGGVAAIPFHALLSSGTQTRLQFTDQTAPGIKDPEGHQGGRFQKEIDAGARIKGIGENAT